MSEVKNVLLAGVGGQGIILASKILATGLIKAGYDVKMSEVHGMAQRGGSVTTQVRFGKEVNSPIIGLGQADILVSFEKMEAVKWIDHLSMEGKVVVNDYEIPSAPILIGKKDYPLNIIEFLKGRYDTTVFKAAELAEEVGSIRTMNVILIGALIKAIGLEDINWREVLEETVKPQFVDMNMKAIELGMSQI